ncbi:MAG TPA: hypothetical protein VI278_14770, partial [Nitrososphaeraceae archaeon]
YDRFPDSEIYIIPARLHNCQIPDIRLEWLCYVDLFPDWIKDINQILKTMNVEIKLEKDLTINLSIEQVTFCRSTLMLYLLSMLNLSMELI